MAAYDPQARRVRPSVADDSPVDDLLGHIPLATSENRADESYAPEPPVVVTVPDSLLESEGGEGLVPEGVPSGPDPVRSFDTPPVEMTDENADRLQRMAVLGAVVAFLVVLAALRRHRRS